MILANLVLYSSMSWKLTSRVFLSGRISSFAGNRYFSSPSSSWYLHTEEESFCYPVGLIQVRVLPRSLDVLANILVASPTHSSRKSWNIFCTLSPSTSLMTACRGCDLAATSILTSAARSKSQCGLPPNTRAVTDVHVNVVCTAGRTYMVYSLVPRRSTHKGKGASGNY